MTAIEEMAGMDVLCSDKTGTLTLNRLTVDRNLIEVHKMTHSILPIPFLKAADLYYNEDKIVQTFG